MCMICIARRQLTGLSWIAFNVPFFLSDQFTWHIHIASINTLGTWDLLCFAIFTRWNTTPLCGVNSFFVDGDRRMYVTYSPCQYHQAMSSAEALHIGFLVLPPLFSGSSGQRWRRAIFTTIPSRPQVSFWEWGFHSFFIPSGDS